jgi:hypothetical protein
MYLTYPIPIQLLDKKLNDFLSEFEHFKQFDFNLTEDERMNVYSFYSLAFAKIARINDYFFALINLVNDCIKKGEVIALIPLKGYAKMELLYVGTPSIFIIIFPFEKEKYSISEFELLNISMELLFHILFISNVMEANSLAFAQHEEYVNLDDPFTELKYQTLRLDNFKLFWNQYSKDFNGFELPNNLLSMIN